MILERDHKDSSQKGSIDVPLYSLSKVSRATDNFSDDNKLGEGGFGPVYKVINTTNKYMLNKLGRME